MIDPVTGWAMGATATAPANRLLLVAAPVGGVVPAPVRQCKHRTRATIPGARPAATPGDAT